MENERLDRIEAALLRLTEVTEAGFSASTQMIQVINDRMTVLESQLRLLDTRMTGLEGQMAEVLGRLRIIGEQLATHTHPDAT